jgi:hypothetical protein
VAILVLTACAGEEGPTDDATASGSSAQGGNGSGASAASTTGGGECNGSGGAGGACVRCEDAAQGNEGELCPGTQAKLEALLACVCGFGTTTMGQCGDVCTGACPYYGAVSPACVSCVDTECAAEKAICLCD